ncbi:Lrp/AsnC ligand binding domain-containing protein [Natrinema zhouii]|uniref:Lrp/AsnC ligand binding domain-containing protein n=1 Tax=Natrinema zhouii TaxID=1710539 RepID=A0A7D6CNM1_9EURY|nr:Lrp/AsnC ligand binding domain-containing protein [Natrinema zhouii]QLK24373.1 Lrp/AsnC ligand binding domain-containing protein [Natrinema zhouii]
MVDAYAMIDTAAGTAEEVCQTLRAAEGVIDAHVIAGDFDIMVELAGDEPHDILETITDTVRSLEGVGMTRTYICID